MKHILIIDDDMAILEALELLLSRNHRVTATNRASDALEMMEKNRYDAVLLDLLMPIMSGQEFLRRHSARGDNTPVIVMTASSIYAPELGDLKFTALVHKPFQISELEAAIMRATEQP